jgi:hypothetical protein
VQRKEAEKKVSGAEEGVKRKTQRRQQRGAYERVREESEA